MTTLFELIVCLLQQFSDYVAEGVIAVLNLAIAGVGAAAVAIIAALPAMPSFPQGGSWGWLNWALPVSSFVALLGTIVGLMAVFFAARIALNWVRAL